MRRRFVTVSDKMQQGYRYALTEPAGRGFDPAFRPELTPKQMLELGVFCGKYSRPQAATVRLTISAWTRASHHRNGEGKAGFILTTRAGGSSGIAAITSAGGCLKRMRAR